MLDAFEGEFLFACIETFGKGNKMLFVKLKCPPIMAYSKDGQDHMDKHFDFRRKIWSIEMIMSNMEALIFIIQKL